MTSRWPARRLKYVCRVNPPPPRLPDDAEVTFVPMEAVSERGGIDTSSTRLAGAVKQGYTAFADGDVLVAKITPCFENGKGSIASGLLGGIGFGTTELHVLRPDAADQRWLFYVTQSRDFMGYGEGSMYGAGGQKRVPPEFVRDFRQPVPPLPTQRAIAAFLDRKTAAIDDLIDKKERLIKLLAEKRAALIHRAVTKGLDDGVPMKDSGVEWIGEIPAHWEVHQLRRVVSSFIDYRGRTPEKTDGGVPLVTAGAVRDGSIDHSRAAEWVSETSYKALIGRGKPEVGDLLFTSEAPLGEVGLVSDPYMACAQRIIMFKLNRDRVLPEFMRLHFLGGAGWPEVRSRASGSTAEGIRADRLKMSLVPTPPLAEQREIVDHVAQENSGERPLVAWLGAQTVKLREYRQALITAAVTGQVEVPAEARA